jgi:ribosomal protein L7Ae-like RNA K-turn-binding protein
MRTACIVQAVNRKQFDRTFRASCQPQSADDLISGLTDALQEHLVALIGMARKSSQIITGGNLVADALDRPEKLALVLLAEDVSEGISEKIERKARGRNVPCLRFLTKADFGRMLGRSERSVTALSKGRLAEAFLAEWQKFKEISGES